MTVRITADVLIPGRGDPIADGAVVIDGDTITCLRSVLMKPEHEEWVERVTALLEASAQ